MRKDDLVRVRHILDAAREATAFVEGRSRTDLAADRMLNLALVRLLEVIGEAVRGIAQESRDAHTEIPWKKMAGMRDRLIHGYFDVNMDVVWETVTVDLSPLIGQLQQLLSTEGR
jgi:uncharacterized protein with HEPN domain